MPPFFLPPPVLPRSTPSPLPTNPKMATAQPETTTNWPPPTLPTASTPPPHAGSHYSARRPRPPFFEGWYLRLTLPHSRNSFAFMFSIEAPALGTMQLLTPSDILHTRSLNSGKFTADRSRFSVGHWGYPDPDPRIRLSRSQNSLQGYQLQATGCHGRFRGESGLVQWGIDYRPLLTWGPRGTARHTATWLSQLQLFEPGYQVLMAHGVATSGYIICDGVRTDITGGVVYCEKNWGKSFPSRWWWVQANGFWNVRDLSILALGATRRVLMGVETVGMIAIHHEGEMYEFANWNCETLEWKVGKWGYWKAWSVAMTGHVVELVAHADERPVQVMGPSEKGMTYNIRDCARGKLSITLRDEDGGLLLDNVCCDNAQVEVGGEWEDDWEASVKPMPFLLRSIVNRFNGPKEVTTLRNWENTMAGWCLIDEERRRRRLSEIAFRDAMFQAALTREKLPSLRPNRANHSADTIGRVGRSMLVSWIISEADEQNLQPSTCFLAINYLERVLSQTPIQLRHAQDLAIVCLQLAIKIDSVGGDSIELPPVDHCPPPHFEVLVLTTLDWQLVVPTVWTFLSMFGDKVWLPVESRKRALIYLQNVVIFSESQLFYPSVLALTCILLLERDALLPATCKDLVMRCIKLDNLPAADVRRAFRIFRNICTPASREVFHDSSSASSTTAYPHSDSTSRSSIQASSD